MLAGIVFTIASMRGEVVEQLSGHRRREGDRMFVVEPCCGPGLYGKNQFPRLLQRYDLHLLECNAGKENEWEDELAKGLTDESRQTSNTIPHHTLMHHKTCPILT